MNKYIQKNENNTQHSLAHKLPFSIKASNLTSFFYAVCMVILIKVNSNYNSSLITIFTAVSLFSGFFLFVIGIEEIYQVGQYNFKIINFNKKSIFRVVFVWAGILVGGKISQYI